MAVTIRLTSNVSDVVQYLEDNGGDPRNVGEDYIEAYVPVSLLGEVSERPGVIRVREIVPPQPEFGPTTSQGVAAHRASPWHSAGFGGQGVKVGIIDSFEGIRSLRGSEIPLTVVGRCYTDVGQYSSNLAACDSDSSHGTGVAEAIVDIAPEVSLYIANPASPADLQSSADWMVSQGVSVINRSASYPWFDGPGDGTSQESESELNTINRAVNGGAVWVNSAGNYATETWFEDSPIIRTVSSIDLVVFDGTDDVTNYVRGLAGNARVILRWDDSWDGASIDLDLLLWDTVLNEFVARSEFFQTGQANQIPLEIVEHELVEGRFYEVYVVHRSGRVPDWVQLVARGDVIVEHFTVEGSINNPSESANPGMLAVGASHYWQTSTIAEYSSQGPTPDDRIKPEIVGTACAASASYERKTAYGGTCWFSGTSQAAPHVAGLAALVKQTNPAFTPEQVAEYLKNNASRRESPIPNNTWGYGFAQLPTPPDEIVDACAGELTGDGTTSGTWAAGCQSQVSGRGYAQYYGFTLEQQSEVSIDLESSVDTFLILRSGDARSGTALNTPDEDDDTGEGTNARIQETLDPGTYTIEATTYDPATAGSFTLTISGLSATTTEPGPGPDPGADTCSAELTGDGTTNGTWAAGCQSQERTGRFARYYTFSLDQQSEVTIELESTAADTYLYLWSGDARSGSFIDEDDDSPDTTRSEIVATLATGDYAIEATTFDPGETGSFTLTVSGLEPATDTGQPPPTTDTCTAELTGDGVTDGTWAAGCQSQERTGRFARYYTFSLEQQSEVTIELESTAADTYLYLWSGDTRSGSFVDEDDDSPDTTRSEIVATLDAGDYTIEATTYDPGETGGFTLTVSGLEPATDGGQPPPTTDTCTAALSGDGPQSGTWAAGCQSEERSGRYARYYTFTLEQQSEVTIELESTAADTYLYLWAGDTRSGSFLDEDDDSPDTTRSEIVATLDAGDYTIEATTYDPATAGSFTLTVSGLSGTAGQEACSVGQSLAPGDACTHQDLTVSVESSGDLAVRVGGSVFPPSGLALTRSGNTWRVTGLP